VLAAVALVAILALLLVITLVAHRTSQGALARLVALSWDRHAVDLPALNRHYRRPPRTLLYVLAITLPFALIAASFFADPTTPRGNFLELLGLSLLYVTPAAVAFDVGRAHRLKQEARCS